MISVVQILQKISKGKHRCNKFNDVIKTVYCSFSRSNTYFKNYPAYRNFLRIPKGVLTLSKIHCVKSWPVEYEPK